MTDNTIGKDWELLKVDRNDGSTDSVRDYIGVVSKPLAELRQKSRAEISSIIDSLNAESYAVAIGISPTDSWLNDHPRLESSLCIHKMFSYMRKRESSGALVPVAPLSLVLVGEYSDKHRWHYHGMIYVKNIVVLDSIKRTIQKKVGRVVTELIKDKESYINYMFKQYVGDEMDYYVWDRQACFIMIDRKS